MMTAKTLEKIPLSLGGLFHQLPDNMFPVEDINGLPASVTIYPNPEMTPYEQMSSGKRLCTYLPTCLYTIAPLAPGLLTAALTARRCRCRCRSQTPRRDLFTPRLKRQHSV